MRFKVVKEDGTVLKTFDTYESAERYYNMMDGVATDYNSFGEPVEVYIYIKED